MKQVLSALFARFGIKQFVAAKPTSYDYLIGYGIFLFTFVSSSITVYGLSTQVSDLLFLSAWMTLLAHAFAYIYQRSWTVFDVTKLQTWTSTLTVLVSTFRLCAYAFNKNQKRDRLPVIAVTGLIIAFVALYNQTSTFKQYGHLVMALTGPLLVMAKAIVITASDIQATTNLDFVNALATTTSSALALITKRNTNDLVFYYLAAGLCASLSGLFWHLGGVITRLSAGGKRNKRSVPTRKAKKA